MILNGYEHISSKRRDITVQVSPPCQLLMFRLFPVEIFSKSLYSCHFQGFH